MRLRRLEVHGGTVSDTPHWRLALPPIARGYANAQIDDYGFAHDRLPNRRRYPWQPGTELRLRARFSHPAASLRGTAGFGFWNAPFGDPTVRWPALPQAVWFFFGSPPNDLPLAPIGPGRGWFMSTVDAARPLALALAPAAPLVLLLNQVPVLRRLIWPQVQRGLGIRFRSLGARMEEWHDYRLLWHQNGCHFAVDDETLFETTAGPHGPLGFVAWIDNQYMMLRATGRFAWGTLATDQAQWLEIRDLQLSRRA